MEEYKNWLERSENKPGQNSDYAFCITISAKFCHNSTIKRHSASAKHNFNYGQVLTNKKITDLYINSNLSKEVKFAELKLCGLLATNILPFLLMDTLTPLLQTIFPDSN